ncbi:sugar phosphate isomerase/epimerase family protein [Pseudomonas gingeri]|uniref:Sugar phosphate isomerase/epimerase n=2 Tax=Pseudomonas gingeri TaxID=117681 RepID=A0A7Y8CJF5_9PSED|nr:sugar phosphate isomerase/epimerase [Pseudomonas gingeri]NWB31500.1 sugar phosphate isomerase/epimerase [Pseudomonas gingeri]NWC32992.1 sugar phosphate isomerase/epimerase [Pseudomonas gingeri]
MDTVIDSPKRETVEFASREAWPEFIIATAQQDYLAAEAGLQNALEQGYSHWYIDGSLEGERPADFTAQRVAALNDMIHATGVKPILHGNFKAPLGSDVEALAAAALDYVKKEVDLCAALGGAPLIVHGGGVVEPRLVKEARQKGLERLITNLQELVAYGKARGVDIWLENLCNYTRFHPFYYICTTEDEVEKVLEAVPGLHLFLDVSHAYVNEGDPLSFFWKFSQRVVGMSFSDNNGDRDSHFPLGQGNLNFSGLVEAIQYTGWKGTVGFETRGGTLHGSVDFLNQLVASSAR